MNPVGDHILQEFNTLYLATPPRTKTWVRSFSWPEKLPLKIHTGSSGTVYSYWVE